MKYLKLFKENANYQSFIAGSEFLKPNVSFIKEDSTVCYHPYISKKIYYVFNNENVNSFPYSMPIKKKLFKSFIVNGVEYIQESENGPKTIVINDIMTYNGNPSVFENYLDITLDWLLI